MKRRPYGIGLTGGIGSGKSTVAAMLHDQGGEWIDADAISRACTAPGGAAMPTIQETFGDAYVTPEGALDRNRMRSLVFSEPAARQRLEAIIHPLVREAIERRLEQTERGFAVLDLPLLVEDRAWQQGIHTVWVVDCSPETQIARVMARNGWSRDQVLAVMAAQASREQRLAIADTVIDNDQVSLEQLNSQVRTELGAVLRQIGL